MSESSQAPETETVGELAELYLGNILYAMELAAMTLDRESKEEEASFYRGIARLLAQAHGRATRAKGV